MQVETTVDVGESLVGLAELNGDIGGFQQRKPFAPFLFIVDGNHNLAAFGKGGFLHLVPHLPVS